VNAECAGQAWALQSCHFLPRVSLLAGLHERAHVLPELQLLLCCPPAAALGLICVAHSHLLPDCEDGIPH
jgi:hypothetical protein